MKGLFCAPVNAMSIPREDIVGRTMPAGRGPEDWSSVVPGWLRGEARFGHSTWPVTQKIVLGLAIRPDRRVLDVGSGIGDPALQIAAAVGPNGTVVGCPGNAETGR